MSGVDKIQPLGNRVVVKPKSEEQSQGGIYIPTQTDEKVNHGEVIAVGPGKVQDGKVQDMVLKVGQKVIFNHFQATEVEHGGEQLVILSEDDVLGIVG